MGVWVGSLDVSLGVWAGCPVVSLDLWVGCLGVWAWVSGSGICCVSFGLWVGCLGVWLGAWVGCLGVLFGVWVGSLGVSLGLWVGCLGVCRCVITATITISLDQKPQCELVVPSRFAAPSQRWASPLIIAIESWHRKCPSEIRPTAQRTTPTTV